MKNTLSDLNNYLFEQIERLQDDSLDDTGLEKEIRRSQAVQKVADMKIAAKKARKKSGGSSLKSSQISTKSHM